MRKRVLRSIAVLAAILLGWLAAGHYGDVASAVDMDARQVDAHQADSAGDAHAGRLADEPADTHTDGAIGGAMDGAARTPAELDVAADAIRPDPASWNRQVGVLAIVAGLFLVALLAGVVGRRFGARDPGAAATEQDQADHPHDDSHAGGHADADTGSPVSPDALIRHGGHH